MFSANRMPDVTLPNEIVPSLMSHSVAHEQSTLDQGQLTTHRHGSFYILKVLLFSWNWISKSYLKQQNRLKCVFPIMSRKLYTADILFKCNIQENFKLQWYIYSVPGPFLDTALCTMSAKYMGYIHINRCITQTKLFKCEHIVAGGTLKEHGIDLSSTLSNYRVHITNLEFEVMKY